MVVKQVSGLGRREVQLLEYISTVAPISVSRLLEVTESNECACLTLADAGRYSVHEQGSRDAVMRCARLLGCFHKSTETNHTPALLTDLPLTFDIVEEVQLLSEVAYYHRIDCGLSRSAQCAIADAVKVLTSECPLCITHGDPHLANWIISPQNIHGFTLIDWAQARMGCGFVDLARFLSAPSLANRFTYDQTSQLLAIESYCETARLSFPTARIYRSAGILAIANSLNWQHIDALKFRPREMMSDERQRSAKLSMMLQSIVTLAASPK